MFAAIATVLPPRIILAAVDFSESSRAALTLAAHLARATGAVLRVVHAEDPLLAAAAADAHVDLATESKAELARLVEGIPPAAECAPAAFVVAGAPADVILHVARREHADLIVVGAHGMSGAGRLLFGSVTESLLLQADRSVLVVPDWWMSTGGEAGGAEFGPLVVGVDFSEPSVLATRAAGALAERLHTSVEAIHVVAELPVPQRWAPHAERVVAERVTIARRDLAAAVGGVSLKVPFVTRVERGLVVEALTAAAMPLEGRTPILILGRRCARSKAGVPGATAYRVASLARVPVLMHRHQD